MTVSSVNSSVTWSKAAAACVLGIGLVLGGCNNKLKDENAALIAQNQALIAENNQLKANEGALQNQINTLNQQVTARQSDTFSPGGDGYEPPRRGRSGGGGGGEVFVVAGDVLFDSGQATLKPSAKKELDSIASRIKSQHSGQNVRVEGYTDSKPIRKSKWGSNEALSEARADAVRKYLISKGISSSRISAVGMGASKLKATDKESRRVEIVVVGD